MQFINIIKITSETTPIALQTYEGCPTWLVAQSGPQLHDTP